PSTRLSPPSLHDPLPISTSTPNSSTTPLADAYLTAATTFSSAGCADTYLGPDLAHLIAHVSAGWQRCGSDCQLPFSRSGSAHREDRKSTRLHSSHQITSD